MITEPTVLILGAGASYEFGFPLGIELVDKIIKNCTYDFQNPQHGNLYFQQLEGQGFSHSDINNFRDSLNTSGRLSIDAFLEHKQEFRDIGKIAIAQALIPCEDNDKLYEKRLTLYSYLFNEMNTTIDEFDKNKLSVISFNYDRSFEHFMFKSLCSAYDCSTQEVIDRLKKIKIIHVHGNLGFLPWQDAPDSEKRDYLSTIRGTPKDLQIASRNIKIIHDDLDDSLEFQEAQRQISEANRIIFLGFGYDKTNLDRLKIDFSKDGMSYYGSCYKLTTRQIQSINNLILERARHAHMSLRERIKIGFPDQNALTFLKENVEL